MSLVQIGRLSVAVAASFGIAAGALAAAGPQSQQPPSSAPSSSEERTAAGQKVTVVGCIQREADFRKAQDAGRGGVAGTGVGVGNEYVLTSASMTSGASGSAASPGAPGAAPSAPASSSAAQAAGASAATGPGMAYELTGSNEGDAAKHVGRRVEITGMLKAAEVGSAGAPTGGPTAGRPPAGVDVTSRDLKLREIEVETIREIGATCPAM
jgi:hypothetical protein